MTIIRQTIYQCRKLLALPFILVAAMFASFYLIIDPDTNFKNMIGQRKQKKQTEEQENKFPWWVH